MLHRGGLLDAFALGMRTDPVNQYSLTIGVGAWLGTLMLFNVWVLIWPNQKKVLGIVQASPEAIAKATVNASPVHQGDSRGVVSRNGRGPLSSGH